MNPSPGRVRPASAALALLCVLVAPSACRRGEPPAPPAEEVKAPTNVIEVPELVRKNLGIEFVKTERRRIAATLRVPGHFELLPAGRREYRTPVAGRVEILVRPLQEVKRGEPLYRITAPEWRRVQDSLAELVTTNEQVNARIAAIRPLLAAHRVHRQSMVDAIGILEARVQSLEKTRESVGGQASELTGAAVQLARMRSDLAEVDEKDAQTEATIAELEASQRAAADRMRLALEGAAFLAGEPRSELVKEVEREGAKLPRWRVLDALEVRAVADGLVDTLPVASGGQVESGGLVLATSDPRQVRFRARALQSDLGRLANGLPAAVVLAGPRGVAAQVRGSLVLGVEADPVQRTIDVFLVPEHVPGQARPGVAGFLEIELWSSDAAELAIPSAAVLQDGLEKVYFRRDQRNPDRVLRCAADLGRDDGRWVEIKSGLVDGDEVVLAGAYELVLASSGGPTRGGHFHADGTFHADTHK